jgi:hypothetical protein
VHTKRTPVTLVAILATAAVGAGATWALTNPAETEVASASVDPSSAARTSFPGLRPPHGEPTLPDLRNAAAVPGKVTRLPGPFDDRFVLRHIALEGDTVTGSVKITSDVSDLLELQVLAAFYDRNGSPLGTGRFVHHLQEGGHQHAGPPEETEHFDIPAPRQVRDRVASAAVGVPVLVNE